VGCFCVQTRLCFVFDLQPAYEGCSYSLWHKFLEGSMSSLAALVFICFYKKKSPIPLVIFMHGLGLSCDITCVSLNMTISNRIGGTQINNSAHRENDNHRITIKINYQDELKRMNKTWNSHYIKWFENKI
jgi:hypothetical protein